MLLFAQVTADLHSLDPGHFPAIFGLLTHTISNRETKRDRGEGAVGVTVSPALLACARCSSQRSSVFQKDNSLEKKKSAPLSDRRRWALTYLHVHPAPISTTYISVNIYLSINLSSYQSMLYYCLSLHSIGVIFVDIGPNKLNKLNKL